MEVQYTYLPWRRHYLRTMDETFDGTFPWNRSAERERQFHLHPTPLFAEPGVCFHQESTPFDWTRMEDRRNYRMDVTMGYGLQGTRHRCRPCSIRRVELQKKKAAERIDVYETSRTVG